MDESGVVHIKTTGSTPDYLHPWRTGERWANYGSGFVIIHNKEVLVVTNAHVVENGKRFSMNTIGTGKDIPLSLIQYLPEIDIAFLKPSEKLPELVTPMELAEKLPEKGSQLRILGFPLGGQNVSTHIGTFNRVIWVTYMDIATGLCMQTDTTMNPGVSGGPALGKDNKVVGVCVSGLRNYQNFNHLIPIVLVRWGLELLHKNVVIGGFPFSYAGTKNDVLRGLLKLPDDLGILITETSDKNLKVNDVIIQLNKCDIHQNGTMKISDILDSEVDSDLAFVRYYPSIRPINSPLTLTVIRNGKPITVNSKISARYRPANILPPGKVYYALAGWVFAPWNRYAKTQHEKAGHEIQSINDQETYIIDEWETEFTEQVDARFGKIIDVNDKPIKNFEHFVSLMENTYKKPSIVSIGYRSNYGEIGRIILDMKMVVEAQDQIMADHANGADRYSYDIKGGLEVAPPALLDDTLS